MFLLFKKRPVRAWRKTGNLRRSYEGIFWRHVRRHFDDSKEKKNDENEKK